MDLPSIQLGPADPQRQSPIFSKLPAELRLYIYDHLARTPVHIEKGLSKIRRITCLQRKGADDARRVVSRHYKIPPRLPSDAPVPDPAWDRGHMECGRRIADVLGRHFTNPYFYDDKSVLLTCRKVHDEALEYITPRSVIFLYRAYADILWRQIPSWVQSRVEDVQLHGFQMETDDSNPFNFESGDRTDRLLHRLAQCERLKRVTISLDAKTVNRNHISCVLRRLACLRTPDVVVRVYLSCREGEEAGSEIIGAWDNGRIVVERCRLA